MKALFALVAGSMTSAAAQPSIPVPDIAKMANIAPGGPGCAIAIVEGGRVVFEHAYGLADLDKRIPITLDTSFNIASMTKQFTGMAVALLIADGKLSESDDIRKYLPELKNYGTRITVANLLNHSTGLRNHMALAAFQPGDHLPSHEEALALVFRQSALNFTAGTRHQYESPNYVLLAEIVARSSGMPYPEFLQRRILQPLNMTNSGYATATLAPSYGGSADKGWTVQSKVNRAMGSSGLQTSVRDFARWMINYDRQTVGGAAAGAKMLSTSKLADGSFIPYRYGLIKEFDYAGVKGLTRISHGGQTAAYRSAFSWFPGRGFGDVVMCNFMVDAHAIDLSLVSQYVGRLKPPQPASVGGSFSAPAMHADLPALFAGSWYSAEDDDIREFAVKDGGLALRYFGEDYPLQWAGGTGFVLPGQGKFNFQGNRLEEALDGQARLHFTKLVPAPPQRLNDFAGTYRSRDVDGPVTIAVEGDRLALTYPAGTAHLRRIARDHFASPEEDFSSVRFQRGRGGKVNGMTLTVSSGITRLRFARAKS